MNVNQILRAICIALFFTLSLSSCKKEDTPEPKARVVFWTKRPDFKTLKPDCYVDGQLVGTLSKAITTVPNCDDADSPRSQLVPGTHTLEFRVSSGQVVTTNINALAGLCYDIHLD